MSENIKDNLEFLDEKEYNKLRQAYDDEDQIEAELNTMSAKVDQILTDIEKDIEELDQLRPGANRTKFDLREHMMQTLNLKRQLINDKGKRHKDLASRTLSFKKDILGRKDNEHEEGTVSADEANEFISATRGLIMDIDDMSPVDTCDIDDEIKKQEYENDIEFTDGEKIMMLSERNYEIVYVKEDKKFRCLDKDTDEYIEMYPESELPDLNNFTDDDGKLKIEDGNVISNDEKKLYRMCS